MTQSNEQDPRCIPPDWSDGGNPSPLQDRFCATPTTAVNQEGRNGHQRLSNQLYTRAPLALLSKNSISRKKKNDTTRQLFPLGPRWRRCCCKRAGILPGRVRLHTTRKSDVSTIFAKIFVKINNKKLSKLSSGRKLRWGVLKLVLTE